MKNNTEYTIEQLLEQLPSLIQDEGITVMSDTDLVCSDLFFETCGWEFKKIEDMDDKIYVEILHTYDCYKYLEESTAINLYRIWIEKKLLK